MNWLTRRRASKTQAEVDAERERLSKVYDDTKLQREVRLAIERAGGDPDAPPPEPPEPPPPMPEIRG